MIEPSTRRDARALVVSMVATLVTGCGLSVAGTIDGSERGADDPGDDRGVEPSQPGSSGGASPGDPRPGGEDQPGQPPGSPGPTTPKKVETVLSPFDPAGALTYQRSIAWTIAAFDPAAVIHYTTDGSTPTTSSTSASGRITLRGIAGGQIKWIAGDDPEVHAFTVGVESSLSQQVHTIVDDVRFDQSGGPIVRAAPGATVRGRASIILWSQSSCPGCIDQITIGIDSPEACLYSGIPGVYQGDSQESTFSVRAPTAPGVYKVRTAWAQEYTCADARTKHPLGATQIGTIIVE